MPSDRRALGLGLAAVLVLALVALLVARRRAERAIRPIGDDPADSGRTAY